VWWLVLASDAHACGGCAGVTSSPPRLAIPAEAPDDCVSSEWTQAHLREELAAIRKREGASIGVQAADRQCRLLLDGALRAGPFMGVLRTDALGPSPAPQCTAVVLPGVQGYAIELDGDCRASGVPLDLVGEPEGMPTHMWTAAWWLPYGGSLRWTEFVGVGDFGGVSLVLDGAWQLGAALQDAPEVLGRAPSQADRVRWLVGLDFTRDSLQGGYLGFRTGAEIPLVLESLQGDDGFTADRALASLLVGHTWLGHGLALQAGAGVTGKLVLREDAPPSGAEIMPVFELRAGFASR
jgi:hypothetical protein